MDIAVELAKCPTGWLTVPEAELLIATAEQTEGAIVEVGSYLGRSSCLLARLGRPVICIDVWDDRFFRGAFPSERTYQAFLASTRQFSNITSVRLPVEECSPQPVGFAYLDGDHRYKGTLHQIEFAFKCGARAICVHDYADKGGGLTVRQACLEKLGLPKHRAGRMAAWLML